MNRRVQLIAFVVCSLALSLGVRGASVAVTPANQTLLVGQSIQLTAPGAVIPVSVATGGWHTCVLYSDKTVRCTGLNSQGQLGDGTFNRASTPILVNGVINAQTLHAGAEHTCTLADGGTMQCWGTNYTGQLGDGTMGGVALVPQAVHNIANALKAVTGGFHTCAILADRTVKCWGRNQDGQLGNGDSTTDVPLPGNVIGLGTVADLAGGGYHNCALMDDRTMRCWGRNVRGQVGDGTSNSPVTQPHPVSGMNSASLLGPGGFHSCAVLTNGTVQCWGQSDWGQVGTPGLAFSATPATVSGIGPASMVAGGFFHSCALLADGSVWCWGLNDHGQLGNGSTTSSAQPVRVTGIHRAVAIATGGYHTCALMADASVQCWGENDFGELGNGSPAVAVSSPVRMNNTGITWTSSNTSVATVSTGGVATAIGRGTATITATDAFGNSGSTTLTVREMLTLNVTRQGDGSGSVTSAPAGINCGTSCSGQFISDSTVVLTATPTATSTFAGWTGCDSVSGTTCTANMTSGRLITAIFMLKRFPLTITKSGVGRGTVTSSPSGINCGTGCTSDFVINTVVTLTATPAFGSVFTEWTGCDAVNGSTCTVAIGAARSVTANFLGIPLF
jgi:alpha-tubulin suppressor-like RCC1 family protein